MTTWRTPVVLLLAALTAPAAGAAAFVAVVAWTGCFFSCEEPDRLVGGLLGVLAAALVLSGPAVGWRLQRGAGVALAAGGLLLGGLVTAVLLGVA